MTINKSYHHDKPGHEGLFVQLANSNKGVMLNVYNGTVSIVEAREDQSGRRWMEFCFPQDNEREPKRPAVPKGVRLGNPREAVGILRQMIEALTPKAG